MSLMGGFDIIFELGNGTILNLLKSKLKFGTISAVPPFEVDLGVAHLIITDLAIDLEAGDVIRVTADFVNSSVENGPIVLSPLDGSFSIGVHVRPDANGIPTLDLAGVQQNDVTLTLSPGSAALVGAGFLGLFTSLAVGAIQVFVSGQAPFSLLPPQVKVVPGVNGSYSATTIQLDRVEAHCVSNVNRANQALAFCGILLAANHGNGVFGNRTSSAIAGADDLAVSLAPQPFKDLVVCPALRDRLLGPMGNVNDLPLECGISKGLNNTLTSGVTVTSITHAFQDGHIGFEVAGHSSPTTGVNVAFKVKGTITLTASFGSVNAAVAVDPPSLDVTLDWWVWLVGAVLGPITLFAAEVAYAVSNTLAKSTGEAFAKAFEHTNVTFGFPGVLLVSITTQTEGLTVKGQLAADTIRLPAPAWRHVDLEGSVVTEQSTEVGNGTIHLDGCPLGDYPYSEFTQQQRANFTIVPILMGRPLQLKWSLAAGAVWIDLVGVGGQVTLLAECHYPLAPTITQSVTVDYSIDPGAWTIHLRNRPTDGNYKLALAVEATDRVGNVEWTSVDVDMEGDHLAIGGTYLADLAVCLEELMRRLRATGMRAKTFPPWRISRWVPVDHPTPERLVNLIREVSTVGGPDAAQLLRQIRLAHGGSFERALLSVQRAATTPEFGAIRSGRGTLG